MFIPLLERVQKWTGIYVVTARNCGKLIHVQTNYKHARITMILAKTQRNCEDGEDRNVLQLFLYELIQ